MGNRARQAKNKQRDPKPLSEHLVQKLKRQRGIADEPIIKKAKVDKEESEDEFEEQFSNFSEQEDISETQEFSDEFEQLSDLDQEARDDFDAPEKMEMFSSDESEESETEFEKLARAEDELQEENEQLAQEELKTTMEQSEQLILPPAEEIQQETNMEEDIQLVHSRISEIIRVLANFKQLREENRSRSEYVDQLIKDIAHYYGYNNFLVTKLFHLFPLTELIEFFEANEQPRPMVIRTNTLKVRRRELAQQLINRGVNLEPIGKWSKVGIQVFDSPVPIGATPEYLAGYYMLQAAASFLPVIALDPQENEKILDMCAAPGGKTTYIAALMKNTGSLVANDINKERTKGLVGNIHRLGVRNSVVCQYDGREFPGVTGGFDRVLLDAPCSGTGVISKDPAVKVNKSQQDFDILTKTQKELILSAIDSIDANSKAATLVYATCSITVEENEQVVQYLLQKRPNCKLVETGLEFGREGFTNYRGSVFNPKMSLCRRIYPHTHNMDGFFIAKIIKTSNKYKSESKESNKSKPTIENQVTFDDEEDAKYIAGNVN